MMEPELLADTLACPKCNKIYKRNKAFEAHVAACVRVVSKAKLGSAKFGATSVEEENIIKIAGEPPELVTKQLKSNMRPKKSSLKSSKTGNRMVSSILEQADAETRWQLIQCNVNQVLDETISSQTVHGLTQKLPPSTFSRSKYSILSPTNTNSNIQRSWWHAANAPLSPHQLEVSVQISQHTPYRCKEHIMTSLKTLSKRQEQESTTTHHISLLQSDHTTETRAEISDKIKPLKNSLHSFQDMLGSDLFSDLLIKVANGDIRAHRILLHSSYPHMRPFLEEHSTIDMTQLSKDVVLCWLEGLYASNWSRITTTLDASAVEVIFKFIQFATSWTRKQPSGSHIRRVTSGKHQTTARKRKRSPSTKNTESKADRLKKTAGTSTVNSGINKVSSENLSSELCEPVSDTAKISNDKKEPTKRSKGQTAKRKPASKYAPLTCLPQKVSPLLSTIGTQLPLTSVTPHTVVSSDSRYTAVPRITSCGKSTVGLKYKQITPHSYNTEKENQTLTTPSDKPDRAHNLLNIESINCGDNSVPQLRSQPVNIDNSDYQAPHTDNSHNQPRHGDTDESHGIRRPHETHADQLSTDENSALSPE